MDQPEWMKLAWMAYGEKEIPGKRDNQNIIQFYADVGQEAIEHDEVAWCAAFLGSCLERAGKKSTRSLMARSYLDWGEPIDEPRPGAIAVLRRGANTKLGHVGFVVRATAKTLYLLGGNQSDQVNVTGYARTRLLGFRWPATQHNNSDETGRKSDHSAKKNRKHKAGGGEDPAFERALAHVLEMEGGYTDDPKDPGGATNLGITIGDFARSKKVTLGPHNLARLKRQLRNVSVADVRPIYLKRYWQRASCPQLPAALALMHFDCAVNQGVARAIPFLQQAIGVEVDGEIGPRTVAAANKAAEIPGGIERALQVYADLRRQHYRGLGHFWRFGKGWLRRVERTMALSRTLITPASVGGTNGSLAEERIKSSTMKKGETDMKTPRKIDVQTKWWGESMTIWGTIITAASTILPVLGPLIGLDVTADIVKELGEQVVQLIKVTGGIIGIVMTVYGRTRATHRLARREVKLMM